MMNALREPQRIVIFGRSSDIGVAIAAAVLAPATHVCLVGRSAESLTAAAQKLAAAGASTSVHICDARDLQSHEQMLNEVFASEVDIAIVAAGVLVGGDSDADVAAAVESLEVNGSGATSWLLHSHARMQKQGHGVLVVLSSFAVARPRPSNWVYGAGKVMLDFATRGLMARSDSPVEVILVRPGFVHSKMTQGRAVAPFAVKPEAVARAVARAVRSGGSHTVWVPGLVKHVARLFAVLPISVVRRLDR